MSGYDNPAAMLWQKTLRELKSQVECVWLISSSSLIRMGASMVNFMIGVKVQTVKNENEIKLDTLPSGA
jgi:hypothetical protein